MMKQKLMERTLVRDFSKENGHASEERKCFVEWLWREEMGHSAGVGYTIETGPRVDSERRAEWTSSATTRWANSK